MNYPSSLSRQVRSVTISNTQNSVVPRTPINKKGNSKRETYKSRNSEEEVDDFDEKEVEQRQMQVKNEGLNKKQATKNNEESS
jgi:hypothetical protein